LGLAAGKEKKEHQIKIMKAEKSVEAMKVARANSRKFISSSE